MRHLESKIQQRAVREIEKIFQVSYREYLIELEFDIYVGKKKVGSYKKLVSPLHSDTSGGKRNKGVARNMKKEGSTRGLEDLILPIKNNKYSCLYIEVKRPEQPKTPTTKKIYAGKQSFNQIQWAKYHEDKQGALSVVCYSTQEIIDVVLNYMKGVSNDS